MHFCSFGSNTTHIHYVALDNRHKHAGANDKNPTCHWITSYDRNTRWISLSMHTQETKHNDPLFRH